MNKLLALWDELRSSLWLVPAISVTVAVGLALLLIEAEGWVDDAARRSWPRLFGGGAEGARGMLAAVAGSMATIAGVTFSITVATLSMTSSQYTSRVLRNFMRDRSNQLVLGVFVGVFAYCLVVLRSVRGGDEGEFVPHLAVLAAVILAFVGIGHLIYFIHHIALSIQATHVIAASSSEAAAAVDRLFPSGVGEPAAEPILPALPDQWRPILAKRTGYVQAADADGLTRMAADWDRVLRLERSVGEFVAEGDPIVSASGSTAIADDAADRARGLVSISAQRTTHQDAGFGIRQIVDVALKALSPGVNDTTTAVICVDHLGAVLARLATRAIPSPYRASDGRLRVIVRGPTFEGLLGEAFDQIRQNASGNSVVLAHLFEALARSASRTDRPDRLAAIRDLAASVAETAQESIPAARDRVAADEARDRFFRFASDAEAHVRARARSREGGSHD